MPDGVDLDKVDASFKKGLLTVTLAIEDDHGPRDQTKDFDALGPAPDYDDCDHKAGWLATGNDRRLRKRRPHTLFPMWSGQSEGRQPGAR